MLFYNLAKNDIFGVRTLLPDEHVQQVSEEDRQKWQKASIMKRTSTMLKRFGQLSSSNPYFKSKYKDIFRKAYCNPRISLLSVV